MSPEQTHSAGATPRAEPAEQSTATNTRKYDRKQALILDAAIPVFTELGLGRARLADVGREVGLKTTSITYYFKRKEDLAAACYLRTIETFAQLAQLAIAEQDSDGDAVKKLFELYFDLAARIRSGEHPPLMLFDEVLNLEGAHADEVFAAYIDMFRDFRRAVEVASPRPLTRQQCNAGAHILLSQLLWVKAWIERYHPYGYGYLAHCMYDLYANGVAGQGCFWRDPPMQRFPAPQSPRDIFLTAATQLINSKGYSGASVDSIVERLHLTKGSFYHHYDSKDELGLACFERSVRIMREAIDAAVMDNDSRCDQLLQILSNLARFQQDAGPLLTFGAIRTLAPELREQVYIGYRDCVDRVTDILSDGIAQETLRAVDPLIASQVFVQAITASHEIERWVPGTDRKNVLELYVRPVLTGMFGARVPDLPPGG